MRVYRMNAFGSIHDDQPTAAYWAFGDKHGARIVEAHPGVGWEFQPAIPALVGPVRAFFLGMREFRSDLTTSFAGVTGEWDLWVAYDRGRDLAHRLTFRHFDK
jgi:hypothetical protein